MEVVQLVQWCNDKKMQAARDSNLVDFENYSELQAMWESRLPKPVSPCGDFNG